jgi:hypothetical protein
LTQQNIIWKGWLSKNIIYKGLTQQNIICEVSGILVPHIQSQVVSNTENGWAVVCVLQLPRPCFGSLPLCCCGLVRFAPLGNNIISVQGRYSIQASNKNYLGIVFPDEPRVPGDVIEFSASNVD